LKRKTYNLNTHRLIEKEKEMKNRERDNIVSKKNEKDCERKEN